MNIYTVSFLRTYFNTSTRKICSCEDKMQHQSSTNMCKVTVLLSFSQSTANYLSNVQIAELLMVIFLTLLGTAKVDLQLS